MIRKAEIASAQCVVYAANFDFCMGDNGYSKIEGGAEEAFEIRSYTVYNPYPDLTFASPLAERHVSLVFV
ncbi:hypothetical protein OPQ81_011911 [Rhizoctonia solani]|nr:hypothetical protein OPQ81_011911 [Rhizoctonia solani]